MRCSWLALVEGHEEAIDAPELRAIKLGKVDAIGRPIAGCKLLEVRQPIRAAGRARLPFGGMLRAAHLSANASRSEPTVQAVTWGESLTGLGSRF